MPDRDARVAILLFGLFAQHVQRVVPVNLVLNLRLVANAWPLKVVLGSK